MNWPRWLFVGLCAVLPWSTDVELLAGVHVVFPAELLVGGLAGWILLQIARKKLIFPPLVLPIALPFLAWGWVSALFSSMPFVSAKYMLVATVHAVAFLGFSLLDREGAKKGLWAFALSVAGVTLYTVIRFGVYFHFRSDQANLAPMPFFDDHTVYAAVIVLLLMLTPCVRWGWYLLPVFTVGLVCSTGRAAWLSLLLALLGGVLMLALRQRRVWLSGLLLAGVLVVFWVFSGQNIPFFMGKDTSSAERWNRYQAALRMVKERPVVGFGPGTYQFQYISYQDSAQMTRISVQAPVVSRNPSNYGRGGGAHSEYFQALSETGWPGLILLLGWVLAPFLFIPLNQKQLIFLFAWLSYWIHGIFNHFLHDPKVSFLIWLVFASFMELENEAKKSVK